MTVALGSRISCAEASANGYGIINMESGWNEQVNEEIIDGLIDAKTQFYIASDTSQCWDAVKECTTTFFDEMNDLLSSGYEFFGDNLLPPP